MPQSIEWLSAKSRGAIGVDRKNMTIQGMVLAQEGDFKDGRGHFSKKSLSVIRDLASEVRGGLKSRLGHPALSSDGIGTHLGRVSNPRLCKTGDGVPCVRGDLKLDASADKSPNGKLAEYVMSLAESDPAALSSSLVLKTMKEKRLGPDKKQMTDGEGNPVPDLWIPTQLHASDIVDTGAAVDDLLSAFPQLEGLSDDLVRQASQLLDGFKPNATRDELRKRLSGFVENYLNFRFGEEPKRELSASVKELHQILEYYRK